MVYQSPSGARDLLPLDVAQKYWIEERVEQIFQRWGYHRIITSTVENLETLMAGGAIEQSEVIELQSSGSERLGLRPELTASIARAAATRLADVTYPQRLCYSANVFQRADKGSHGGQQEYYQAGVELLGADGMNADAEVLLLLANCINSLKLGQWHGVLGDAGLTRSLLSPFPDKLREAVRQAIASLDRVSLETLPLTDELRTRALILMDLRGKPADVLQRVSQLALTPSERQTVEALKALVELLQSVTQSQGQVPIPSLILDLSLIKPFDYYTGIVFEVVSETPQGCQVIGQGGRYNNLLSVFDPQGQGFAGIGFMLNIEALHQVLIPTGQLPHQIPPTDWLVVPTTPEAVAAAFAYAQTIRASENLVRVEVDLSKQTNPDQIRAIAQQRQIQRVAWIPAGGLPEIEVLT
ncbi:MAG: ATP phosphoribosyltransferase regulatory subunit [Cyanobacteria bacterium P01_A01_bin.123]